MEHKTFRYSEINNLEFHKTKNEIAWHASNRLLGQGYSINILRNGKDDKVLEEAWAKIEKENHFWQFMLKIEYNLSYYGNAIATIYKTKAGDIRLGIADPRFYNEVARVNIVDDIAAVTYRRYKIDATDFYIKENWTRKEVTRSIYDTDNQEVNLLGFNSSIPEQYRIKARELHNLGVVPVLLFLNKQKDIRGFLKYSELSDTYTVTNQIRALNTLRATQLREAMLNTTKVFGNFDESSILKMSQANKSIEETALRDVFVQVARGDNNNGSMVEILKADPKLNVYDEAIQNMLRNIWRGAGYTYTQSGDTMSGNAETLYANSADISTTKLKKGLRQEDYSELIKRILITAKLINYDDDIDILVKINENVVQSPNQTLDYYLKLHEQGLLSSERVLQKLEQLPTLEQATSLLDEAKKEAKEDLEASLIQEQKFNDNLANDKQAAKYEPKETKKEQLV